MVVPSSPLSPDSDLVTVEEFYCLVPDGQKADLIDGVIYMASPDTRRSDRLGGFIKFLMQGYAAVQGLGEVYGSRFAFELSQFRAPEPDAAFVGTERLHLVSERRMVGGPDIAVEIVSRESRQRDYGEKKQLYADAGVSEYWIIDPLQRRVEFHRLRAGRYEPVPLEQNRIFQIPPDLVVKFQAADIADVILMSFYGSSCNRALGSNGKSRAELPSLSMSPSVTTKSDGMWYFPLRSA